MKTYADIHEDIHAFWRKDTCILTQGLTIPVLTATLDRNTSTSFHRLTPVKVNTQWCMRTHVIWREDTHINRWGHMHFDVRTHTLIMNEDTHTWEGIRGIWRTLTIPLTFVLTLTDTRYVWETWDQWNPRQIYNNKNQNLLTKIDIIFRNFESITLFW